MVKLAVAGQIMITPLPVIVAVIGTVPLFTATKEGMSGTVPLAARPIAVLLFVHVMVVFVLLLLKESGPTVAPAQTVMLAGVKMSGVGLIVILLLTVVVPHSFVTAREKL